MEYYGGNDFRDYKALKHYKYVKRERVNGKWRYTYPSDASTRKQTTADKEEATNTTNTLSDRVKNAQDNSIFRYPEAGKAPDYFKPDLTPKTHGSSRGYINSRGFFIEGDYENARQLTWEMECKILDDKAAKLREEQTKPRGVISGLSRLPEVSEELIAKGKEAVNNFLNKLSKRKRD